MPRDPVPLLFRAAEPGVLLLLAGGICAGCAVLSALVVRRMIRLAVMDVPSGRSAHARPVPRGGGAGLVAALLAGLPALLAATSGTGTARPAAVLPPAALLLAGIGVLAAVSWIDDLRGMRAGHKFLAQVAGSVLAVAAAATVAAVEPSGCRLLATGEPVLPAAAAAGALFWMLLVVNALNFIDGLNGLAAGATALCGVLACGFALRLGAVLPAALGLVAAAGLAGFLPFNYPKARIFMGDVGSQVCGLAAGALPLLMVAGGGGLGDGLLPVPLMLGGILWDVLFTLARRLRNGERVTQAHRGHLYQVAARCGTAPAGVAAVHWGFVLWGAVVAALLERHPAPAMAAVVLPQLGWTALVAARARRAGLGRWS